MTLINNVFIQINRMTYARMYARKTVYMAEKQTVKKKEMSPSLCFFLQIFLIKIIKQGLYPTTSMG